jgi:hypothetical protein
MKVPGQMSSIHWRKTIYLGDNSMEILQNGGCCGDSLLFSESHFLEENRRYTSKLILS